MILIIFLAALILACYVGKRHGGVASGAYISAAELLHVGADKITIKGAIPEADPMYDGKDPLDRMCWQVKDKLLTEHSVCVYYQIDRKVNLNGERTIDVSFMLSYTGKYDGSRRVAKDEQFRMNVFSMELAGLLDEFLLDFNRGCKCAKIQDPERSLRIDPYDYQTEQEKKKKKKKNLQHSEKPNNNAQEMLSVGSRKATNNDLSSNSSLKTLPDDVFVDED